MAIAFMRAGLLRRGDGGGFLSAAAYCHGIEMVNERTGIRYDFSAHDDVDRPFLVVPHGSANWASDIHEVAHRFERAARQYDAQMGRWVIAAIPIELSHDGQSRLANRFSSLIVDKWGVIVVGAIHGRHKLSCRGHQNPHLHLNVTNKSPVGEGFSTVIRGMNNFDLFKEWRQDWERLANEELAREGHGARIDMRSYAEQGLALEAQVHEGKAANSEHLRTGRNPLVDHNRAVRRRNAERMVARLMSSSRIETAPYLDDHIPHAEVTSQLAVTDLADIPDRSPANSVLGASASSPSRPPADDAAVRERTPATQTLVESLKSTAREIGQGTASMVDSIAQAADDFRDYLAERKRRKEERRERQIGSAIRDMRPHVRPIYYEPYGRIDFSNIPKGDPVHRHSAGVIDQAWNRLREELIKDHGRRQSREVERGSQRWRDAASRNRARDRQRASGDVEPERLAAIAGSTERARPSIER